MFWCTVLILQQSLSMTTATSRFKTGLGTSKIQQKSLKKVINFLFFFLEPLMFDLILESSSSERFSTTEIRPSHF